MSNFILNQVMVGDKPMVRYLMKQKGGNVEGKTSPQSAMWMLTNDKAKVPHMTEEFPGFPLTADGVYFFNGRVESGELRVEMENAVEPEATCGPDYCEIPEVVEKPKKSRKMAKDVVCE